MANIFLESFDNVANTADLNKKSYTSLGVWTTIDINGRTNNGLRVATGSGFPISFNRILPNSYSTIIFGCAFKTDSDFRVTQPLWTFADSEWDQIIVSMDSVGRLVFARGQLSPSPSILLGVGPKVYDRGSYYYFEFKIIFSVSTAGSINYRVNGISQPPITGVQTSSSSNAVCNIVRFSCPGDRISDQNPYYFDDVYANDTTGSDNNDYMGDVRIFVDQPAAVVTGSSQWALSGAASKPLAVGDVTPDGDATYISSNTAGQVDLYTLAAPPSGLGVVKAVQTNLVARKDDGIIRQIAPVLGDGVHTNAVGASVSIGNNYVDYLQSFDRNPITGAAWVVGDLSTLQVGVKEIV